MKVWPGMNALALLIVAAAGALNSVQSGANAQLVRSTDRPWLAALIVSLVTAAVFAAGWAITGLRVPEAGRIPAIPWWAWTGGLGGAAYVAATLFFAGTLGASVFTGVTVTAGIAVSILVDHFGLIGFAQHTASPLRILGVLVMVGGLVLVARF